MRVGAVILTYNSSDDLPDCLSGLIAQDGVELCVIVVDNASQPAALAQMEKDFRFAFPDAPLLSASDIIPRKAAHQAALFLRNGHNDGYSAGNNIGARVAAALDCNAVLIVNPDIRISNSDYVRTLAELITADPKTAVACSAIRNLKGIEENPMREPSFLEELFWPFAMISAGLLRIRKPTPPIPKSLCRIDKASGSCFMIRTDFLRHIGFFDETVFLYCEEAILGAQVRAAGWHMMMEPGIEALHCHQISSKGDPVVRFDAWMKSRGQFHRNYGGYGFFRQTLLAGSRMMCIGLVRGRAALGRLRNSVRYSDDDRI